MALLKTEAERLSNNTLASGIIETIFTQDDIFSLLNFERMNGKALLYNREKSLPTTAFRAPGDTITESSGNTEEVVARLRAIIGDVDVDSFLDETMGDTNSQKATQIQMKTKATARKFSDALINGGAYSGTILSGNPTGFVTAIPEISDPNQPGTGYIDLNVTANTLTYTSPGDPYGAGPAVTYTADGTYVLPSGSPSRWVKVTLDVSEEGVSNVTIAITIAETKEFTGIRKFTPERQTIYGGTNGGALSFDLLDELIDLVRGAPVDCIVMPRRTIRAYRALVRATSGGLEPAMLMDARFGKPMLTYNGYPILQNEWIPTTETRGNNSATTSIYAMSLQAGYGVEGLYGGAQAGIRVQDIGALETKDADRTRVKWYTSLKLGSELAVGRLAGITN